MDHLHTLIVTLVFMSNVQTVFLDTKSILMENAVVVEVAHIHLEDHLPHVQHVQQALMQLQPLGHALPAQEDHILGQKLQDVALVFLDNIQIHLPELQVAFLAQLVPLQHQQ